MITPSASALTTVLPSSNSPTARTVSRRDEQAGITASTPHLTRAASRSGASTDVNTSILDPGDRAQTSPKRPGDPISSVATITPAGISHTAAKSAGPLTHVVVTRHWRCSSSSHDTSPSANAGNDVATTILQGPRSWSRFGCGSSSGSASGDTVSWPRWSGTGSRATSASPGGAPNSMRPVAEHGVRVGTLEDVGG